MILCHLFSLDSMRFWKFSRNHLTVMNTARRLRSFCAKIKVPERNHLVASSCRQATQAVSPVFWVFDEWPGDDEHPPGDASQIDSILVF